MAKEQRLIQGNEACSYGALYAGCNFYAGYPITPATDILEIMSRELPKRGGVFLQMEDEIASMAAVIGASWAGAKAMTATSGPGFSLMQENIGYASMTETPCVVVNAQRWGPSTGQPTRAARGDVMQAIWGPHGDHPVIVLTAASVEEVFKMIVTSFNYAERYRVPVIFLLDEVLAHLRENVTLPEEGELEVVNRQRPARLEDFKPFQDETMLAFGEGVRFNVTGLAHDEEGFYAGGAKAGEQLQRIVNRVEERYRDKIVLYEERYLDDAERLIISYGTTTRAAEAAVEKLRRQGIRVGLLDLKTLWPFPTKLVRELAERIDYILVPELNMGQVVLLVRIATEGAAKVRYLGRVDGNLIFPYEIYDEVMEEVKGA